MKRFKTKYVKVRSYYLTIILIVILVLFIINSYNKRLATKFLDISSTKIDEITNIYILKIILYPKMLI